MLITVEFPVIVEGYPAKVKSKHVIVATHMITIDIKEIERHQLTHYGTKEIDGTTGKFYTHYFIDGSNFFTRRKDTLATDHLSYDFKFEGKAGHPIQEIPQNTVLKKLSDLIARKTKNTKIYPALIEEHHNAYRNSKEKPYKLERSRLPRIQDITLTEEGISELNAQENAFRANLEKLILADGRLFSLKPEPVIMLEQFDYMPPTLRLKDDLAEVFDEAFEIEPWELPPKVFTMSEHAHSVYELNSNPFEGKVNDCTNNLAFSIKEPASSTIDIVGANACILADTVRRRSAATLAGITPKDRYPTMSEMNIIRHIDEIPSDLFNTLRELGIGIKQFRDGAGRETLIRSLDSILGIGDIGVWIGEDILKRIRDTVEADLDSDVSLSGEQTPSAKPVI